MHEKTRLKQDCNSVYIRFNAHLIGSCACILNSATLDCSLNSGFNSDDVTLN